MVEAKGTVVVRFKLVVVAWHDLSVAVLLSGAAEVDQHELEAIAATAVEMLQPSEYRFAPTE